MSNVKWHDEDQDQEFDEQAVESDYTDQQPEDEFVETDYGFDDQEDQTAAVMNEAVLRIEQANLYQTLLSHNLFAKGSARPEIINKVQTEMRAFILSRLEILLGIKTEKPQQQQQQEALPFDSDQVDFLKSLADRGLRRTTAPTQPVKPTLNPVQGAPVTQPQEPASRPAINPAGNPNALQAKARRGRPAQPKTNSEEVPIGRKLPNGNISYNGQEFSPRKAKPIPRKQKSSNVSEIDGKDLSQAVNPANPPKPMPSQAVIDQMNASQVANITQDSAGKASMAGLAAAKLILGR